MLPEDWLNNSAVVGKLQAGNVASFVQCANAQNLYFSWGKFFVLQFPVICLDLQQS